GDLVVNSTLSNGILILFFVSALIAFLVPFFTDKVGGRLSFKFEPATLKTFGVLLVVMMALYLAGNTWKFADVNGLKFFAIGLIVPFLLARIAMPPRLTGVLLLLASVLVSEIVPVDELGMPIVSMLVGITTWKLAENYMFAVLPSL